MIQSSMQDPCHFSCGRDAQIPETLTEEGAYASCVLRKERRGFPGGIKFGKAALCLLLSGLMAAAVTGCAGKKDVKETQPEASEETMLQTEEPAETEALSEEELVYVPVQEILDEKMLAWAETFDEDQVSSLVYTALGEDRQEFVIEKPGEIRRWFDALMQLEVAGRVDSYAAEAGDTFDFYMKNGDQVSFAMLMGSLLQDGVKYETAGGEALWELTGNLLFPEAELQTGEPGQA